MLTLPHLVIQGPLVRDQILVSAGLHHLAVVQNQNLVAVNNRAQSLGDDDRGPSLRGQVQRRHDVALGDRVQLAGGFVEYQNRTVF